MTSLSKTLITGSFLTAAVTGALLAFPGATENPPLTQGEPRDPSPVTDDLATQLSDAFERVAESIRPSVVAITAVKRVSVNQDPRIRSPFPEGPFSDLFDRFHDLSPGQDFMQQGVGSGFVYREDGYILTNNHVVGEAEEVTVHFDGGRELPAEVVGTDPKTDLALLKVDADDLVPVHLGDSDALRVGQWVVAAGTPFGLTSSITAGIVSATGRSSVGIADYEDFIQTDASINPGNSGGPLVNLKNEVVGVNTAIFTRSGGDNGIGFAIPVNMVRLVVERLVEDGRVVRGWLGVYIQNLDEGLARSFGYDQTAGALVGDVPANSPADRAGIREGDIITAFAGKEIPNRERLRLEVAATRPGTEVEVKVYRDGEYRKLEVEIGELEGDGLTPASPVSPKELGLGLGLRDMTPEISRQLGYETAVEGVLVTEVEPYSVAARIGIRARDVIVAVQGEPVETVQQFRRQLEQHDLAQGVRLTLRSGEARRFVFLRAE